ncbi:MAG: TIGR01777 family oxidoreductase [Pyrinomonadaceae bacterium]
MKILISGAHGLIGSRLAKSLDREGVEVWRLVRGSPSTKTDIEWQPTKGILDKEQLAEFDVVVHLAGESIASGRWTADKKKGIRESRVVATGILSTALSELPSPPRTFVCASAIGIYGDRDDEVLTEDSKPGSDFLASVCVEWENACRPAIEKGIRTVNARFGIVLDTGGGALAKMLPPFRMGIGGRVGSGKQWMSWIVLDDVIAGLKLVLRHDEIAGPVNFVAPNPVTNQEFTKALGTAVSRPTLVPIPEFGVRLAFGEMGDALLLSSQRVEPKRLKEVGYEFKYAELRAALSHVLKVG